MRKKERARVKEILVAGAPFSYWAGKYSERELKEVEKSLSPRQMDERVKAVQSAIATVLAQRQTGSPEHATSPTPAQ